MSWTGDVYDGTIGRALRGIRHEVADLIRKERLFPVLDLCCGTGAQLRLFQHPLRLGLDIDGRMLIHARRKCPAAHFMRADASRIPIRGGTLGGVIVSYALHEKDGKTRREMMAEIRRVLHPNGRLILIDFDPPWNLASRIGWIATFAIERMAGGEHFRNGRDFIRAGGLSEFVREQGLEILRDRPMELGNSRLLVTGFSEERLD